MVLDTNVFVSATLSEGPPFDVLEHAEHGDITLVTSPGIIQEVHDVLTRERVPFPDRQFDEFIEKLLSTSHIVAPAFSLAIVDNDPDDDKIVECAVAADADYIVSGDSHLLDLESFQGIEIVAPADFLDRLRE